MAKELGENLTDEELQVWTSWWFGDLCAGAGRKGGVSGIHVDVGMGSSIQLQFCGAAVMGKE